MSSIESPLTNYRLRLMVAALVVLTAIVGDIARMFFQLDSVFEDVFSEAGADYADAVFTALVTATVIALVLHWLVFRPLDDFRGVIERRKAGARGLRLQWRRPSDELGNLGHAYDEMVETIESQREALDVARINTIKALAAAIDAKDRYTRNHSDRVAHYAAELGRQLGWDPDRVEKIRLAGLVHDIGKIAVPDAVLLKPGRLTDDEFEQIKQHCAEGQRIMQQAGMRELAAWIRGHHERWDGGGYPDGLPGGLVPIEARVLALADSFEAMTSNRSYRKGMSITDALTEVNRCAGTQFDPSLIPVFEGLFEPGGELIELQQPVA